MATKAKTRCYTVISTGAYSGVTMNNILARCESDAALMSLVMLKMSQPDLDLVISVNIAPDDPRAVGWRVWQAATEHLDDAQVKLYVAAFSLVDQDVELVARIVREGIIA